MAFVLQPFVQYPKPALRAARFRLWPQNLRSSCRVCSHFGTLGHPSAKYPLKGRYSQQECVSPGMRSIFAFNYKACFIDVLVAVLLADVERTPHLRRFALAPA